MACYVLGIGANIDSPQQQLHTAISHLQSNDAINLIACSSLYTSRALTHIDNPAPQPDFFNMVAAIDCHWHPEQLLSWIHFIEHQQGRQRQSTWQARPLDIDILLYSTIRYSSNRLSVPHPAMHLRDFVVRPLLEIQPQLPLAMHRLCPDALVNPEPQCHMIAAQLFEGRFLCYSS